MTYEQTFPSSKTGVVPRRRNDLLRNLHNPAAPGVKRTIARQRARRTVNAQISAKVPLQATSFQSFAHSSKRVRNSLKTGYITSLCFQVFAHSLVGSPVFSALKQNGPCIYSPNAPQKRFSIMSSYTNRKEYKFDVLIRRAQTKHHGPLINA
jgi:hypothetical protein